MKKFDYVVNTFSLDSFEPVQCRGEVVADNEYDAIKSLIENGMIYPTAYEFLELKEIK